MSVERIEKTRQIKAPVAEVSALIEDVKKIPKWNPLLNKVTAAARLQAENAELEWEAAFTTQDITVAHYGGGATKGARKAGTKKSVPGSSKVIAWKPGQEYAWRSTDRLAGVTYEGRFLLRPVGNQTQLTATLSYDIPNVVVKLLNRVGVKRLLARAVETALSNIDRLATRN